MERRDEEMIFLFMRQQKTEVEDNGFSRRVMHRLPNRSKWADRLFNLLVAAVSLFLFYIFDGVELVWNHLEGIGTNVFDFLTAIPDRFDLGIYILVMTGLTFGYIGWAYLYEED